MPKEKTPSKESESEMQVHDVSVDIHHFDGATNHGHTDEFGDKLNGYYFQLIGDSGLAISNLNGPYISNEEAEGEAVRHYENGTYD